MQLGEEGIFFHPHRPLCKAQAASETCLVVGTGTAASNIVLTSFRYTISPGQDTKRNCRWSPTFPSTDISAHILQEKHVHIGQYSTKESAKCWLHSTSEESARALQAGEASLPVTKGRDGSLGQGKHLNTLLLNCSTKAAEAVNEMACQERK